MESKRTRIRRFVRELMDLVLPAASDELESLTEVNVYHHPDMEVTQEQCGRTLYIYVHGPKDQPYYDIQ